MATCSSRWGPAAMQPNRLALVSRCTIRFLAALSISCRPASKSLAKRGNTILRSEHAVYQPRPDLYNAIAGICICLPPLPVTFAKLVQECALVIFLLEEAFFTGTLCNGSTMPPRSLSILDPSPVLLKRISPCCRAMQHSSSDIIVCASIPCLEAVEHPLRIQQASER